jgi:hypothetical protein
VKDGRDTSKESGSGVLEVDHGDTGGNFILIFVMVKVVLMSIITVRFS